MPNILQSPQPIWPVLRGASALVASRERKANRLKRVDTSPTSSCGPKLLLELYARLNVEMHPQLTTEGSEIQELAYASHNPGISLRITYRDGFAARYAPSFSVNDRRRVATKSRAIKRSGSTDFKGEQSRKASTDLGRCGLRPIRQQETTFRLPLWRYSCVKANGWVSRIGAAPDRSVSVAIVNGGAGKWAIEPGWDRICSSSVRDRAILVASHEHERSNGSHDGTIFHIKPYGRLVQKNAFFSIKCNKNKSQMQQKIFTSLKFGLKL